MMKRKIIGSFAILLVLLFAFALGISASEASNDELDSIFEFKGYSVSENGDACIGFTLNHEAKNAYEEKIGKSLDIGIVIASYASLNGQAPLDENGVARELESGKVITFSLNNYKNTAYNFKLINFADVLKASKYVISPYVFDGENAYYYENGSASEGVSGISYNEIISYVNEHKFVSVVDEKYLRSEATCKEYATYYKSCSLCGESSTEWFYDTSAYAPHNVVTIDETPATCTQSGLTEGSYCSVCNEVFKTQEIISAKGHSYNSVTVQPTCTSDGYTVHTCSSCGNTYQDGEIASKGHTEAVLKGYAATCTENGLSDGKYCSVCNEVILSQTTILALGHTEKGLDAVDATCTSGGLTAGKYCSVCEQVLSAQTATPALGHNEAVLKGYASTCSENGLTDGKYCTVCNEVTVKQVKLDKISHTEIISPAVQPTCQSEGKTEERYCKICGEITSYGTVIPMTGHTAVTDKAVSPNCSESGLTEGSHCSVCGTVIKAQTVVPATGDHVFEEFATVTNAPTTSATGTGTIACTKCSYKENITFDRLVSSKLTKDDIYSIESGEYNPAEVNRWKVVDGKTTVSSIYNSDDWFGNVGDVLVITLDQEMTLNSLKIYTAGNYTFATVRAKDSAGNVTFSKSICADGSPNGGDPQIHTLNAGGKCKVYTIEVEITSLKWDDARTLKISEIEIFAAPNDSRIPHAHNYREFIEAGEAATCQSEGYDIYECFCGKVGNVATPKTDHAYNTLIEETKASCMVNGKEVYKCFCGATNTVITETVGHVFEKLVSCSVEPTLESTGTASYKCLMCSLTEERTLAMLPLEEINYLRVDSMADGKVTLKLNLYEHLPSFEVRYSTSEITAQNYYNAEVINADVSGKGLVTITIELDASLDKAYYVAVMPYIGENCGEIATIRVGGNDLLPIDNNRVYHGEVLNSFAAIFDNDISTKLGRIFTDVNDTQLYGQPLRPIVDLEYMHYVSSVKVFYDAQDAEITVRWSDTAVDFMAENSEWDGYKTFTVTSGWNEIEIDATIRYFQIIFTDGEAPCEVEAYGFQSGEGSKIATYRRETTSLGELLGMCGFVAGGGGNTPIDSVICTNVLREYHNFHWSYTASKYGQQAALFVNPKWMGDFDSQYAAYKAAGINVIPCIQWSLGNGQTISYKVDENGLPIRDENGELVKTSFWERFDPNTYFVYADNTFAFSARYGRTNTKELLEIAKLHCADTPSVGQGTIEWIELGNEPDGGWNGIHNYLSAYMLAAATSAAYDGHCSTIPTPSEGGYHLGGKNADPTMKFAVAGIAGVSNEYINALIYWMNANRKDGYAAFDAFNVHHYMTKEVVLPNGSTAYVGISPEEAGIEEVLSNLIDMRDKYYPEKEVWITEFGWDTNQSYSTSTSSHAYGEYTGRQVQAMWLTRSYLIFAACGIDKADMYMCEDAGVEAESAGKYGTCGVIGYERDENGNTVEVKKDSYYYLYTLKNALSDYTFDSKVEAYDENVKIYKFTTDDGKEAYAVWCPTSNGTKVNDYQLRIDSERATVIEAVYGDIDGVRTETIADEYGYVSVDVSENPIYVIVD